MAVILANSTVWSAHSLKRLRATKYYYANLVFLILNSIWRKVLPMKYWLNFWSYVPIPCPIYKIATSKCHEFVANANKTIFQSIQQMSMFVMIIYFQLQFFQCPNLEKLHDDLFHLILIVFTYSFIIWKNIFKNCNSISFFQ